MITLMGTVFSLGDGVTWLKFTTRRSAIFQVLRFCLTSYSTCISGVKQRIREGFYKTLGGKGWGRFQLFCCCGWYFGNSCLWKGMRKGIRTRSVESSGTEDENFTWRLSRMANFGHAPNFDVFISQLALMQYPSKSTLAQVQRTVSSCAVQCRPLQTV